MCLDNEDKSLSILNEKAETISLLGKITSVRLAGEYTFITLESYEKNYMDKPEIYSLVCHSNYTDNYESITEFSNEDIGQFFRGVGKPTVSKIGNHFMQVISWI